MASCVLIGIGAIISSVMTISCCASIVASALQPCLFLLLRHRHHPDSPGLHHLRVLYRDLHVGILYPSGLVIVAEDIKFESTVEIWLVWFLIRLLYDFQNERLRVGSLLKVPKETTDELTKAGVMEAFIIDLGWGGSAFQNNLRYSKLATNLNIVEKDCGC
jgi:hypothetical protein